MLPKLEYIRHARIRLGVTQRKLASMSGVSASMINQIETGRCKPSYETARRIFEALSILGGQTSLKAGDICSRSVLTAKKSELVVEAAKRMREKGFSQLPVLEGATPIGLITEEKIIDEMVKAEAEEIRRMTVGEVMDPIPPIVDQSTPANTLTPLVRFSKAILVSENGRIIGIITASDLLKIVGTS